MLGLALAKFFNKLLTIFIIFLPKRLLPKNFVILFFMFYNTKVKPKQIRCTQKQDKNMFKNTFLDVYQEKESRMVIKRQNRTIRESKRQAATDNISHPNDRPS